MSVVAEAAEAERAAAEAAKIAAETAAYERAKQAAADEAILAYFKTYNLDILTIRPFNNYGPRQNLEKLIPKTITNVLDNKMIPVYGRGNNIRDWIYVEDHCRAILDVFYAGGVGQKYNIGGQCEISNYDMVRLIIELMGASEDLIEYVDDRPGHDLRYAIDNAKIKNTVSFSPKYTLEEGIEKTIKWYV